jgi:hypothetical protein
LATCHGPGAADNYSLSSTAAAATRSRLFPRLTRETISANLTLQLAAPRFNCETTSLIKFHWAKRFVLQLRGREVYFGIRRLLSRVSFLFCLRDAQEKVSEKRMHSNASNSALERSH